LFRKIVISILLVQSASAIPRFAIKEGASCNTCHVNPAGGALRNDYGMLITSADELPMPKTASLITLDDVGQLTDHLRIGADLRMQAITDSEESSVFPMQRDLYAYFDLKGMVGLYVESEALMEKNRILDKRFLSVSQQLHKGRENATHIRSYAGRSHLFHPGRESTAHSWSS
jgi:hypothetical protein